MIQRPDADGPPDLDAFFDAERRAVGATGAPVTLATGRALLQKCDNDPRKAVLSALSIAQENLARDPQVVHCTYSLDIDETIIRDTLSEHLSGTPLIARSINKKDSDGTIEVLLMNSADATGITFASATASVIGDGVQAISEALSTAARQAADAALAKLESKTACTFMVFSHTPGADPSAARKAFDEALPSVIAYGGPAVGASETGEGWSLCGGAQDKTLREDDVTASQTVHIAAVPGSLSFLYSAVIKNWAQPAYSEPLSYMSPTYVDDPEIDLLTAIRYDDWEKFTYCIEEKGVPVDVKWVNKQSQTPLLAACARARTNMIKYLLDHGANPTHRNDGGFTAAMYTRMLTEYDATVVQNQLEMLEAAGANTSLTEDEITSLKRATSGRIVE